MEIRTGQLSSCFDQAPDEQCQNDAARKILEAGPAPRAGNASTPGMTTNSDNQSAGASFRMVVDVSELGRCDVLPNTPDKVETPNRPYYRNLFDRWANDQHFPRVLHTEKLPFPQLIKKTLTLRWVPDGCKRSIIVWLLPDRGTSSRYFIYHRHPPTTTQRAISPASVCQSFQCRMIFVKPDWKSDKVITLSIPSHRKKRFMANGRSLEIQSTAVLLRVLHAC